MGCPSGHPNNPMRKSSRLRAIEDARRALGDKSEYEIWEEYHKEQASLYEEMRREEQAYHDKLGENTCRKNCQS